VNDQLNDPLVHLIRKGSYTTDKRVWVLCPKALMSTVNSGSRSHKPQPGEYLTLIRMLLQGIAEHALQGDPQERSRFLAEMGKVAEQLNEHLNTDEIGSRLKSALGSLEQYNARSTVFLSEQATVALKSGTAPSAEPPIDHVTGLPARVSAEQIINKSITAGKRSFATVMLVRRLASINTRYGRKVGDAVMMELAQRLAQGLPEGASLCRWSGPAFAAIVENGSESSDLNRRIARVASMTFEKSIESQDRLVMLPITLGHSIQKISPTSSAQSIFMEMDRFVTANAEK
jgi:diguanylate cyclase (GGDEF)-like protein